MLLMQDIEWLGFCFALPLDLPLFQINEEEMTENFSDYCCTIPRPEEGSSGVTETAQHFTLFVPT